MATARQSLSLLPLTKEDMYCDDCPALRYDDDVLQLQADCANVLEGRVEIETFDPEYQEKIRNYYRFYGSRPCIPISKPENLTNDTLDFV